MSDENPDWIASFDQVLRGVVDIAKVMRVYYLALRDAGFTEEEAFRLTMSYQASVFAAGTGQ